MRFGRKKAPGGTRRGMVSNAIRIRKLVKERCHVSGMLSIECILYFGLSDLSGLNAPFASDLEPFSRADTCQREMSVSALTPIAEQERCL